MSLSRNEMISCPACGSQQSCTVWSGVNVSVDPSLKEPLLDGRLTTFECETCGETAHLEFDLLYHDMDRRFAIWLKYPNADGRFDIQKPAKDLFDTVSADYICRIVPSFQELTEKVRIFDDGCDDHEIEVLKLLICIREGIDIAHPLYYHGTENPLLSAKQIVLILPTKDDLIEKRYSLRKSLDSIQPIVGKLSKSRTITEEQWLHINREHMLRQLEKAGLMRKVR